MTTALPAVAVELAADLATKALQLARVFTGGGRLVVVAPGRLDHARHVAVEFVHPAITGARSLPAVAVAPDELGDWVRQVDAVLLLESDDLRVDCPVPAAAQVLIAGRSLAGPELVCWYHVLWELVQLGLEHPGLTGGSTMVGGDSTGFLYPFLDAAEVDESALLASMAASAAAKQSESGDLGAATLAANGDRLQALAGGLRRCADARGTVFAIGNGGSSCDAARLVRRLRARGIRSASLAQDSAILTALANDIGVDQIFARQVEASLQPSDVLVVFSTSGGSTNLLAALDCDVMAQAVAVACAGYAGGAVAVHPNVDHVLAIDSTSVHRIQEAQGALIDELCSLLAAQEVHL